MEYENPVLDEWENAIKGLLPEYHTRLASRIIGCLGIWLDETKREDVINDIAYHRRQIDAIIEEDKQRSRYHKEVE